MDKVAKAEAAHRLANDPLLKEAFAEFDKALDDRALAAPARDDDGRRRLTDARMTLRKVQKHLEKIIFEGKAAAEKAARDIGGNRWI